ncbi:MAG: homoserine dehydrogenase [Planctomycetes bacterium]|nr:homoserine dehydrogenase [Planctomycetota bacterium]
MAQVTLGLIGLGTVGTGVVRLLRENGDLIEKKTGIRFRLKRIADRGIREFREFALDGYELSESADAVLDDPEIEIAIELIGGYEPARTYLLQAIERGKHVVTANKALLARFGGEIFALADQVGVEVGFEGSVAGTVPIIRVLQDGLAANRIEKVAGIVNGTTNYILTKMTEEGLDYEPALAQATAAGFAEADPTLDVDGEDAAHKLAILATLAFGVRPEAKDIHVEGIRGLGQEDIRFARESGYVLKLLAIGRKTNGHVELRVHPALVPKTHPLASVRNEFNAVFVRGDASRETMYYGRGAGQMPTASAVLSDIIEIAERSLHDCRRPECRAAVRARKRSLYWSSDRFRPVDGIRSRYYLRFPIVDAPGAIGTLTTILGRHGVSIAAVHASIVDASANKGRIEILTHEALESAVKESCLEIGRTGILREKERLIRVEE